MVIDIYSKGGILKLSASPADGDKASCGIQEENVLSISFTAFECVSLEVYDYVDFLGTRYMLLEGYDPKMNARKEWAYSIRLYGPESVAAQTLMVNPTDGADNPQVTLTAPAAEHAALIVANMNRRTGTTQWSVGEVIDTPYIDIDYTGKYVSDAISELATAAKTEWWFDGFTLNISRCEFGEPIHLEYGGALLSGITCGTADGAKFFTRLFPLGSARNIDLDKYGYPRLQLPSRDTYIDSGTERGIIEHFEEDAFAGIYPRRVGTVGAVRSEVRKGEGEVDYTVWYFTDPDIPFNPNDYEIGGLVKNVTFQSGELRGRVFEVNYDAVKKEFEIITQWPYENGVQLPTPPLIPAAGDEYILWNISMPESYYPAAEREYLDAVQAFVAENQKDVSVFQASTDFTVVGDNYAEFRPGRRVRIVSNEYFPNKGYRDTRIISIARSVAMPGSMTLVMSDVLSTGKIQNIESGLNEVRGATSKISTSISASNESLSRKLNRSEFYDLFEKVNIGTADAPKYAIRAKCGLYTEDFLTGLGRPASISGGGGGGASALSELNDVLLSASLASGDLLQYNGTHWVNIPQSSLKPDLSGYATVAALKAHATDTDIHVTTADRAKWDKTASDLSSIMGSDSDTIINKWEEVVAFLDTYTEADTLANLLSNKADKAISIKAGAGLAGGGTLAADRTLSLAPSGVSAGTYPKVTVDAYGRVTKGASLAAADIPTLDISKIENLQNSLSAKLDKAVFDDFFEKVNIGTAAAPKYAIRAKYGLYTEEFLTGLGRSASISGGGGGESYDRLDSWADYTPDKAGYVLSAGLGWDLNSRVKSLEAGSALSFVTSGSGNVVTGIAKSGNVVTITKGLEAATAQSLLGYVTIATAQTIAGAKTFSSKLEANAGVQINGSTSSFAALPYLMLHVPNVRYSKLVMNTADGALHLLDGGATSFANYRPLVASSFVKAGGTYTQLLVANGETKNVADFFLRGAENAVRVDKSVASLGTAADANAWNSPANSTLLLSNYNNALSIFVGGIQNERVVSIQAGHNNMAYAAAVGTLHLNKLGGPVYINNSLALTAANAFTNFSLENSTLTATVGAVTRTVNAVLAKPTGGFTSMNAVAALGNCIGMTNLSGTDPTDNPSAQTGWHHFINISYNYESNNMWQTQIANMAGTTDLWVRSRAGSSIVNGTAWKAPWARILTQGVYTIDASTLDPNTWYPVVIPMDPARGAYKFQIVVTLNGGVPSWATHSRGFSTRKVWTTTGNGYGQLFVTRQIIDSQFDWSDLDPVRGIGQMGRSSHEYVYVRGGGKYHFNTNNGTAPRLITESYTNNGETVAPTTTVPQAIVRTVAMITDNVASANKWATPRKLWGQYVDGTSDVNGDMTIVGAVHSSVGISTDGYLTGKGQPSTSDARLKRHVEDVAFTIDQIAAAPMWRFAWRHDGSIDVGSTAQYWHAVMPELTHVLPDAYLGLDYGKAALLASVSLARAHRNLEGRVAELERENKKLKCLITLLK